MKLAEAQQWIQRRYGTPSKFERTRDKEISVDDFEQILVHIDSIKFNRRAEQDSREFLLYDGCVRFGRWFPPSPFFVPLKYGQVFRRCALKFQKIEKVPNNSSVFMLHTIRDDIYAEFAGVSLPLTPEQLDQLERIAIAMANISRPGSDVKRNEFDAAKQDIESIISGLREGTLRSHIRTALPYPIAARPIQLSTRFDGLTLHGSLNSGFSTPPSLMAQSAPPAVLAPQTTTRWSYGRTDVHLAFSGLVDPSIEAPPLQLPSMDAPAKSWPNSVNVAFEVVYQVCWELRKSSSERTFGWIPAPGDIGDVETWLECPGSDQLGYIRRGHPSLVSIAFVPSSEPLVVSDEMQPSSWHVKCRVLADQYARFGEMREALFWLNVGVEALLKERMDAQVVKVGSTVNLDELDGADAYWDQARELVRSKFPDIVDEIEWPRSNQKPSRFRQLKYFCRHVDEAPAFKAASSNYSKVSRDRNKLFHGENEAPITVDSVAAALEGFDWLTANFCP